MFPFEKMAVKQGVSPTALTDHQPVSMRTANLKTQSSRVNDHVTMHRLRSDWNLPRNRITVFQSHCYNYCC